MSIAVQQQNEIEVYVDDDGQIAISQSHHLEVPISCVTLLPQNAEALISGIRIAKRKALEAQE